MLTGVLRSTIVFVDFSVSPLNREDTHDFFLRILFIYLTDRDHKQAERQAERGGSRFHAEQRA